MAINFLGKPLVKALLNQGIPFYELMTAYDIQVSIANIDTCIYGFTYVSRQGNYYLILNSNISYETQCKVFIHELKHVLEDCPRQSYYIGMDMQYEYIEIKADRVAEDIVKYCV
jgi:Zn-dependent peptidase ImmA (M78 family)